MAAKIIFLLVLLIVEITVSEDVIKEPKKFTRSRYSHRKTTSTTTELPTSNDENSVDMVTDVFSEELFPNKVEESATSDPFAANETVIMSTSTSESLLNNSTDADLLKLITEEEVTVQSTEQSLEQITEQNTNEIEVQRTFNCGEAINQNHPWIAVLVHTDPSGRSRKKTLSKGVLIDQRYVLTTVSSLHNSRPFWIVSEVRLGDTPVLGDGDQLANKSSVIRIGIEEIFQHRNKDIALIKLAENINFTQDVLPICLPEIDDYNSKELNVHMCKKSNQHSISKNYNVSTVSVFPISLQDCAIMFRRKKALLTSEEFCAWDEIGDSCTGDLGGPLFILSNGSYKVIGLKSHINSKGRFNFDGYPGVYVRVGSHLSWIKKITSIN